MISLVYLQGQVQLVKILIYMQRPNVMLHIKEGGDLLQSIFSNTVENIWRIRIFDSFITLIRSIAVSA